MEPNRAVIDARNVIVLRAAGGEMTALDFCDEMIRRGWALPDFTPQDLSLRADDILRLRVH